MPPSETTTHRPAYAYRRPWRIVAGVLTALGGMSLPVILLVVLIATDPPVTPPDLAAMFAVLTVIPIAITALTLRAFRAEIEVHGNDLVVARRDVRLEIPCDAIASVTPWTVPLPGPGVSFRLRSRRRLGYVLQLCDPAALLEVLARAGVGAAEDALGHPTVVWARARGAVAPWRWYHLLVKYVLFGFVPAAVLFNAHQHISYGGTFGQYYIYGLGPYLQTLGIYWGTIVIYLVLYAGVWRGIAEATALMAASAAPSRAARVRHWLELGCGLLYYAGVPLLLLVRFLP